MAFLNATLATLLFAASSFAARWSAIDTGLPSTSFGISTLAIDPATPSTLYAVTGAGVIFKSTDAGGSWRRSNGIFEVSFLAIEPRNSAIYAITSHGVVKSLDGADSWNNAGSGLTGVTFSLAINPIDPSTLYAVTSNGVFKSTNGGENWNVVGSGSSPSAPIFSMVIDPTSPSTLYARYANRTLVKSTDGGESWTAIQPDSTVDYPITCVAVDPANSSTLYVGYLPPSPAGQSPTAGVFKSMDGGMTWNAYQQGMPDTFFVSTLTIDPLTPSTIYAVVESSKGGGVVKSADGGQSWNPVNDGLPSNFSGPLAIDPVAPSNIYAGCSQDGCGAVFKSTQGGGSWKGAATGLTRIDASVLTIGSGDGTLYTGVRDGLFKSSDNGASWAALHSFQIASQPVPPGVPANPFGAGAAVVHSLLIDFINPNVLYVETTRAGGCAFNDKVVFKSTDAGASWDDSISPPDSGCVLGGFAANGTVMAMDTVDPKTLYLGETEDEDGFYSLLKSSDGGAHWASIWDYNNGLQSDLNAVAINPKDPATLYAGVGDACCVTTSGLGTGVIKSTDGGATWNATGLKDTAATLIVVDPGDASILYAGTQGIRTEPKGFRGLFKSIDSGASWSAVNNGLTGLASIGATITALVIAPNHSNILYAGTSRDGVYKSVDGAATWVKFNEGMTSLEIRALAISPSSQNVLYAATPDGIFRLIEETPLP